MGSICLLGVRVAVELEGWLRYIEDITRWREDMNFIFECQNNMLRTKIHIFKPPCNVLFIV